VQPTLKPTLVFFAASTLILSACHDSVVNQADRQVYQVIKERQQDAIGTSYDVQIDEVPPAPQTPSARLYSFTPRPVEDALPDIFAAAKPVPAADPSVEQGGVAPSAVDADVMLTDDVFTEAERAQLQVFSLSTALAYAAQHAREFQDAKEDLYLAALDLTLERHLWTPQWVASVEAQYANYGQVRDFDRAMSAVSQVAVTQRLPFGGEVAARVVNSIMRDLGVHTTSGESGNFILSADIPLWRGAGKVAYESRYQAERELIYAVRDFESFRRAFLVDISADYFALQAAKAAIDNAYDSYVSRRTDLDKAATIAPTTKSRDVSDLPRARSSLRSAEANLVSAKERYLSALDTFKIRIGMPIEDLLDVVDQDLDTESEAIETLLPDVTDQEAIDAALRFRLDLLTSADIVDDARRGVLVARNRILPDLNIGGSATLDTDPAHLNSTSYNTERTTWRADISLRMDDRKAERTAYRASIIAERQSDRRHEQFENQVRAEVRRTLRRVRQQDQLRLIQEANVEENEFRAELAAELYNLGRSTNQDKVDAEIDLLNAKNDYAVAVAAYRNAILEFRRDTGTLRITDDGSWFAATDRGPAVGAP
jgi:outer membrane protein TolC